MKFVEVLLDELLEVEAKIRPKIYSLAVINTKYRTVAPLA